MSVYLKDPDAVLDYAIDWGTEYLGTDTLANSEWAVEPVEAGGLEVAYHQFDVALSTVKASGGIAGHVYQLINYVDLASGRKDSRSIVLRVEKR
jgi:hypothetical protein